MVELGWLAEETLDLQGQSILEEIAQVTCGKAFFPRSMAEMEDITTRIALALRRQYSLGYISANERRDGRWRKIKLRVKPPRGLPHLRAHAKEGYYAVP
jgi:Ca-activated chloride channel family protein